MMRLIILLLLMMLLSACHKEENIVPIKSQRHFKPPQFAFEKKQPPLAAAKAAIFVDIPMAQLRCAGVICNHAQCTALIGTEDDQVMALHVGDKMSQALWQLQSIEPLQLKFVNQHAQKIVSCYEEI